MKFTSSFESGRLTVFRCVLGLSFLLGAACNIHAATPPVATATISDTALGGGEFQYTIVLDNTGTGPLGTFWYSWVPGKDFMTVSPTNVVSPTNFTANITNGGSSDGFAIQWVASTPLAGGATADFSFESTETPSEIAGNSAFYPTFPQGTAFAYSGAPFSDAGDQFVVQAAVVPEPSTLGLLVLGTLGIFCVGLCRTKTHSRI